GVVTGFGDHDIAVRFRNGAGVTTPVLSRRVSSATTLVVEFAASSVGATAGANTIEIVRTGPNPPELTSNWIQFDYLRLESLPGGSAGTGALNLAPVAPGVHAGLESRWDDPAMADLAEVHQGMVSVLGSDYLTLSYRQSVPAPSGVRFWVEGSSDLSRWSTEGMALLSFEEEEDSVRITIRDGVPLGETAHRFLRLRVGSEDGGRDGNPSGAPGH
ncbi:MAG: hypothetical protein JNL10_00055, partial [Verrucomicrobiales bacterium]|nr:hypothetical protein [Verrucomicrobiales bacterium]